MSIQFQHSVDVVATPDRAFAVLDDFAKTPQWLERCTGIEALTPGAHQVGTKLRYSYREPGRSGTMEGEITARAPSEHLAFRYADKIMDVMVDFKMAKTDAGARLTHTIDITPKTFMAKLFSGMIRRQLPKQTISAMEKLRNMLEARA